MQGQKYSRKQKTYKENHNARSSNTQTQRTIKQHARMHNAKRIYKKNSRKQKTYKENHNARSSNTQTQRTIKQHARMHNT